VHRVPSYRFKFGCCLSEVTEGSLLITGGGWCGTREVVRFDTCREFAVSQKPPMLTPRNLHAAVYHSQLLNIVGGSTAGNYLRECERYVCAERRWEALSPLSQFRNCKSHFQLIAESLAHIEPLLFCIEIVLLCVFSRGSKCSSSEFNYPLNYRGAFGCLQSFP
jgi:hypothetical protein